MHKASQHLLFVFFVMIAILACVGAISLQVLGLLVFGFFFLAELDLLCCTWAFSSCGEWGLLFVAVCGLLIVVASLVARVWALGHRLSSGGAWSQLLHSMWNLSSPARDQTRIPCIGRCILNHWTSREFPALALFLSTMAFLQIYVSSHIHLCMYQYGASQLSPW